MAQGLAATPAGPPVLSTPDTHMFEDKPSTTEVADEAPRPSDEQLYVTYEIERTVQEIRRDRRKRIALQFPDHLLVNAPFVARALYKRLHSARQQPQESPSATLTQTDPGQDNRTTYGTYSGAQINDTGEKLFILADTSYGSCCVDEVAAEHADADVVVHYGRSCLSPSARLPVIYVFTKPSFDIEPCIEAFRQLYHEHHKKVLLMADVPYCAYLPEIYERLISEGYSNLFLTSVVHDVSSPLPNRTCPQEVTTDAYTLSDWQLFHISHPPQALLLMLSSRVGSLHIYSPSQQSSTDARTSSTVALRRRYALLTSLTTAPIFGILINTLSVRNYLSVLEHVKSIIAAAGKKSYTFVVGKVNPAKVANFSEVGGWVVIGCWESSLFDSKDFWKPLITPFELELALRRDDERIWTGQWTSDFQAVLDSERDTKAKAVSTNAIKNDEQHSDGASPRASASSEEESAPPEFDLRTGRYVSQSRPMGSKSRDDSIQKAYRKTSMALAHRPRGDVANINGVLSPAANYLSKSRTWQGLGSDFDSPSQEIREGNLRGVPMEEGRKGIAKGYASAVSQSTS